MIKLKKSKFKYSVFHNQISKLKAETQKENSKPITTIYKTKNQNSTVKIGNVIEVPPSNPKT